MSVTTLSVQLHI